MKPTNIGLVIKGLCPGLPEVGKIKIGMKGAVSRSKNNKEFQMPQKLDHFRVTTLQRGDDGNYVVDNEIHKSLGARPNRLKIRLLYDDPELNFPTRLTCYNGASLWCYGNNEVAFRMNGKEKVEVPCPCERIEPDFGGRGKCKYNGVLSVILEDHQRVGGVWKFRTTSYNSVVNILSSMAMIQRISGGKLAGIPLELTILPKTVNTPITGQVQTIFVVGLEYRGSMLELAQEGAKQAIAMAEQHEKIKNVEAYAKQALLSHDQLDTDLDADIVDEFYPEERVENGASAVNALLENNTVNIDVQFEAMLPDTFDEAMLAEFINQTADANNCDTSSVKRSAVKNWGGFWDGFQRWSASQKPEEPEPTAWSPLESGLMSRYSADKKEILLAVAAENGIPTDGRMPKDVHADILAASQEPPEETPLDRAAAMKSQNPDRWNAIVKTMMRSGDLKSSFMSEWTDEEMATVTSEFESVG